MVPRLQESMEFRRPQTYARIDIYDRAADMLRQRRSEALEDIVWTASTFLVSRNEYNIQRTAEARADDVRAGSPGSRYFGNLLR